MSIKDAQELEKMIDALEKRFNRFQADTVRNVSDVEDEFTGLRAQIDKLAKRVADIEKYLRNLQQVAARKGIDLPRL